LHPKGRDVNLKNHHSTYPEIFGGKKRDWAKMAEGSASAGGAEKNKGGTQGGGGKGREKELKDRKGAHTNMWTEKTPAEGNRRGRGGGSTKERAQGKKGKRPKGVEKGVPQKVGSLGYRPDRKKKRW